MFKAISQGLSLAITLLILQGFFPGLVEALVGLLMQAISILSDLMSSSSIYLTAPL